jgi:hypothetical protein
MSSKKLAILAILGLLVIGGAGFGYYTMKMNEPSFKGVAIPVKGVEDETVDKWVEGFQTVLARDEVLQAIVDKTDYSAKLEIPTGEAVDHLQNAIKVEHKKRSNMIAIGLMGKRKQDEYLVKIGEEIYRAAEKEVAIKDPTFLQFLQANSKESE